MGAFLHADPTNHFLLNTIISKIIRPFSRPATIVLFVQ
jgi:hypothetical protein